MHWFREHPAVIRNMIGFLVITIVLCFLLGPTGILYAVGFEVIYLLAYLFMVAFATLWTQTYTKTELRSDSK